MQKYHFWELLYVLKAKMTLGGILRMFTFQLFKFIYQTKLAAGNWWKKEMHVKYYSDIFYAGFLFQFSKEE